MMLERILGPYQGPAHMRYDLGCQADVRVRPKTAVALVMAFNELATNAAKYDALSSIGGRVAVRWEIAGEAPLRQSIRWEETGGPPVHPQRRTGFGTRLIAGLSEAAGGKVTLDFASGGLVCRFDMPLDSERSS